MANHTFFATPAGYDAPSPPAADDESAVPVWPYRDDTGDGARVLEEGKQMAVAAGVYRLEVKLTAISRALLQRVDGATPLGEMLHSTEAAFAAATAKQVRAEWLRVFRQLNGVHYLVLNPAR